MFWRRSCFGTGRRDTPFILDTAPELQSTQQSSRKPGSSTTPNRKQKASTPASHAPADLCAVDGKSVCLGRMGQTCLIQPLARMMICKSAGPEKRMPPDSDGECAEVCGIQRSEDGGRRSSAVGRSPHAAKRCGFIGYCPLASSKLLYDELPDRLSLASCDTTFRTTRCAPPPYWIPEHGRVSPNRRHFFR